MSTVPITSVFQELFSAPLEAAVKAETEYRRIWADWLDAIKSLVVDATGNLRPGVKLDQLITEFAPAVSLNGAIDVAITMRIAEARERDLSLGGGLSLGPIFVSGAFSSKSTSSEESVLKAATTFTLSNTGATLAQFLQKHAVMPEDAAELTQAAAFVRPGSTNTLPVVEIKPTSLLFGEVAVGTPSPLKVAVKNVAGVPLIVKSIKIGGQNQTAFAVDVTSLSLNAGESKDVTVTFTPAVAGDASATLTIACFGSSNEVPLTAKGK